MDNYILLSILHSGKSVVRAFKKFAELRAEIQREKELKAFYREALYETRNGNLKKIQYGNGTK